MVSTATRFTWRRAPLFLLTSASPASPGRTRSSTKTINSKKCEIAGCMKISFFKVRQTSNTFLPRFTNNHSALGPCQTGGGETRLPWCSPLASSAWIAPQLLPAVTPRPGCVGPNPWTSQWLRSKISRRLMHIPTETTPSSSRTLKKTVPPPSVFRTITPPAQTFLRPRS